jgi:uncharacterized RDD family membrane protein YckC
VSDIPPPPSGSTPPPPPPPTFPPGAPPPPRAGVPPPASFAGPPGYAPESGAAANGPRRFAGFWLRLAGSILDAVLYGLLLVPFAIVGAVLILGVGLDDCSWESSTDELICNGREDVGGIVAGGIVVLVGWLLVLVLYLRALARTGQTWGRKLAGVQVVTAEGGVPPGWGKAIGRTLFAGLISSNFCYLGYLWMLWDSKNQTWHDKVAGTVVVEV